MKLKQTLVLMTTLLAWGCGGDKPSPEATGPSLSQTSGNWLAEAMDAPEYEAACAQTPGCGETRYPAPGAAESLWRVHVIREASGQVRIDQVETIDVPKDDGVPVGPLSGSHVLVGLDTAGEMVDGQLLHFPDAMRVEYVGGESPVEWIDLTDREVDAIGYLRASLSIVTLAVQDTSGTTMTSMNPPAAVATIPSGSDPSSWWTTPAWAATRPWQGLPPYCSHVLVLEGEQDRHLALGITFEETVTLARPGPLQLAAAQTALGRMTPMLCQSIGRIAFGYVHGNTSTGGAVNSAGAGDLMLINLGAQFDDESLETMLSRRLWLQRTITHEAGHNAETLLTVEGSEPGQYSGSWGFPPRTMANKTIENVRLEKGLPAEWRRLHESFVDQDWAVGYGSFPDDPDQPADISRQVTDGGFMSHYGSKNWWDDIAEFVAHTYLSGLITDAYREHDQLNMREDSGCQEMQGYSERNLPSRFAAVYTKLRFIQDLGLVDPEDVGACLGNSLGLPDDGQGFHFYQGTMKLRSFENQMKAVIGTKESGVRVFEMEGSGEANFADKSYPTKLRLRLDLGGRFDDLKGVSWPRGVYELGLMGDNNVLLRLDGAKAGNFDAMDGFVLVAEASKTRIAGSIVLQRVMRLHAPLPVPEKYDPPLVIRFSMEH